MLSREEVLKIASLARLELTEPEIEFYRESLGRVLGYIDELNAVATDGSTFVRHVPKDAVAFREDRGIPFANVAALIANAPAQEEGSFLVPAVMEAT